MKRLLHTGTNDNYLDFLSLILRVSIAAFMLTHGLGKLNLLFSGNEIQFADPFGLGATFSLALTVFAEVLCSILIGLGLLTRLASIPLIITMLVAVFMIHADDPFAKKEFALLYLLIYLVVFVVGSRKFSLDYLLQKKK
ncbi:putative oxidoreductase [Ancylomarina subtilis]|uniref:Putative oxidoreductase n=1 Tax=Ancylomarina subtilis TaxID=1639035 RepID=A0A4Q7VKU3_9BACT|nr:DoxX family protein [Ancylomarina subtilis]RZT96860.1 putative oxidoreductase [Ancylomarina subtilis]